jgi:hypothetical protein
LNAQPNVVEPKGDAFSRVGESLLPPRSLWFLPVGTWSLSLEAEPKSAASILSASTERTIPRQRTINHESPKQPRTARDDAVLLKKTNAAFAGANAAFWRALCRKLGLLAWLGF